MKVKYSEAAFEETINSVRKHIDGCNSLEVFIKMINDLEKEYPRIKSVFIHDMGEFLSNWFEMVNDSNRCSLKLRAKLLTIDMVNKYSNFGRFTTYCYDHIDDKVNPYTNRLYTRDLLSYLSSIMKAIVQTTRRHLGFDNNSKKYGNS